MSAVESADHKLDPNYAVVVSFLEQFGQFIVQNPQTLSIENLDKFLLNNEVDENDKFIQFHLKMLAGIGNRTKPEQWEKGLIKFCKDFPERDDKLIEEFEYVDIPVAAKLRILKNLCEDQFEYNNSFNVKVNELLRNKIDADVVRHMPAGSDRQGRTYWYMTDKVGNVRLYRGVRDDTNNTETWTLVCSDPDELKDFIDFLQTYDEDTIEDTEFIEESPVPPDKLLFSNDFLKVTDDAVEEILEETKDPKQIFYKVPKARTTAQIKRDETKHSLTHCFIKMLETDKTPADRSLEKLKELEKLEEMEKEKEKKIESEKFIGKEAQESSKDGNLKKDSDNSSKCNEFGQSSTEDTSDKVKNSIEDDSRSKARVKDVISDQDESHDKHEKPNDSVQNIEISVTASESFVDAEDGCEAESEIKQTENEEAESTDTCSESETSDDKKLDKNMPGCESNSPKKTKSEGTDAGNKLNIESDLSARSSIKEHQSEIHKKRSKEGDQDCMEKELDAVDDDPESDCEEKDCSYSKSKQDTIDEKEKSENSSDKRDKSSDQVEIQRNGEETEHDISKSIDSNSCTGSVESDDDLDMKETLMRISELSDSVPSPVLTSGMFDKTSTENEKHFVQEKTNVEQNLTPSYDSADDMGSVETSGNDVEDNDSDHVAFDEALKGLKTLEEAVKSDVNKDDNGERLNQNGYTDDKSGTDPFDDALKGLETLEKIIDQGNTILGEHKTNTSCDFDGKDSAKNNSSNSSVLESNKSKEKYLKNAITEIGKSGDNKKIGSGTETNTNEINIKGIGMSNVTEIKERSKQKNEEHTLKDQDKSQTSCQKSFEMKTEATKSSKELSPKASPDKVKNKEKSNSDSPRLNNSILGKILKVEIDRVDKLLKVEKLDLESGSVNVGTLETDLGLFKMGDSKSVKVDMSMLNGSIKQESSDNVKNCSDRDKATSKNEGGLDKCIDKKGIETKSVVNSDSKIKDDPVPDCMTKDKSEHDHKKVDQILTKDGTVSNPEMDQKKAIPKCDMQDDVENKTHTMIVDGDVLEINQLSTDSEGDDTNNTGDVERVSEGAAQKSQSLSKKDTKSNEVGENSNSDSNVIPTEATKQLAFKALKKNLTRIFTKDVQFKHKTKVVQTIGVSCTSLSTTSNNVKVITVGENGVIGNPQASTKSPEIMNPNISNILGSVGSISNPIVLNSDTSHRKILPKIPVNLTPPSVQINLSGQPLGLINPVAVHPQNSTLRSMLSTRNVNQSRPIAPAVIKQRVPHQVNSLITESQPQGPNYMVNMPDFSKMVTIGSDGKYYDKSSGKPFNVPQNGKQIRVGHDGKFYDASTLQPVQLNMSKSSRPMDLRPGATFFLVPTKNKLNQGPQQQNQNNLLPTNTTQNIHSYYSKITAFTRSRQLDQIKPRKRRGRYKKEVIELSSSSDSDISFCSDKEVDVVDNSDSDYDYDTISRRIREAASKSTRRPTKMPSYIELSDDGSSDDLYIEEEPEEIKIKPPPPPKEVQYELLQYPCSVCGSSDNNPTILMCEECRSTYHMGCLTPPLLVIPVEDWFCPQCEHLMLIETLKEKYQALRKLLYKKQRQETRITQKMFAINKDNIMERSRSSRSRKEVNYDETRFDKMVKNAVKEMNESENEESAEETSKKTRMSISSDESDKESLGEKESTDVDETGDQKATKLLQGHKSSKSLRKRSLRPKFCDSGDEEPVDRKRPKTENEGIENRVKKDRSVSVEKDQRHSKHSKRKKDKSKRKGKTGSETHEKEGGNKSKRTASRDSDFNLSNADQNSTDTDGESGDTEEYGDGIGKKQKPEEHIYYTSSGRKTNSLSKLKNVF